MTGQYDHAAHSGFLAVKQLIATKDLFEREFVVARSAIGGGLAAAANVVMGADQTRKFDTT